MFPEEKRRLYEMDCPFQCTCDKVVERLVHKTIVIIDQPGDGLPQLLVADEHQGKGKAGQPPVAVYDVACFILY